MNPLNEKRKENLIFEKIANNLDDVIKINYNGQFFIHCTREF